MPWRCARPTLILAASTATSRSVGVRPSELFSLSDHLRARALQLVGLVSKTFSMPSPPSRGHVPVWLGRDAPRGTTTDTPRD